MERFGRVSGKVWPALAGSVPCPYYLKEEDEDEERKRPRTRRAGWQNVEALPCGCCSLAMWWRCGGDSIAQKRTRWPPVPLPECWHKRAKW